MNVSEPTNSEQSEELDQIPVFRTTFSPGFTRSRPALIDSKQISSSTGTSFALRSSMNNVDCSDECGTGDQSEYRVNRRTSRVTHVININP